jgi:hypothetical protein
MECQRAQAAPRRIPPSLERAFFKGFVKIVVARFGDGCYEMSVSIGETAFLEPKEGSIP